MSHYNTPQHTSTQHTAVSSILPAKHRRGDGDKCRPRSRKISLRVRRTPAQHKWQELLLLKRIEYEKIACNAQAENCYSKCLVWVKYVYKEI